MPTSRNNIVNKTSIDPIEQLIFEKGLRITQVIPVLAQDSLIVFLNNGTNFTAKITVFEKLKHASQKELDHWQLINNGVGIEWPAMDEDLSLKGLIQQLIIDNTLRFVAGDHKMGKAA